MNTFADFLNEAFKSEPIKFGINVSVDVPILDDKKYIKDKSKYITFFKYLDFYYCLVLDEYGNVEFRVSKQFSLNYKDYSFNKTNSKKSILIFNYIIFVVSYLARKLKLETLKFNGNTDELHDIYVSMSKNKSILNIMHLNGYEYKGIYNGNITFKQL